MRGITTQSITTIRRTVAMLKDSQPFASECRVVERIRM